MPLEKVHKPTQPFIDITNKIDSIPIPHQPSSPHMMFLLTIPLNHIIYDQLQGENVFGS